MQKIQKTIKYIEKKHNILKQNLSDVKIILLHGLLASEIQVILNMLFCSLLQTWLHGLLD